MRSAWRGQLVEHTCTFRATFKNRCVSQALQVAPPEPAARRRFDPTEYQPFRYRYADLFEEGGQQSLIPGLSVAWRAWLLWKTAPGLSPSTIGLM